MPFPPYSSSSQFLTCLNPHWNLRKRGGVHMCTEWHRLPHFLCRNKCRPNMLARPLACPNPDFPILSFFSPKRERKIIIHKVDLWSNMHITSPRQNLLSSKEAIAMIKCSHMPITLGPQIWLNVGPYKKIQ
jgi:hypothetical protein